MGKGCGVAGFPNSMANDSVDFERVWIAFAEVEAFAEIDTFTKGERAFTSVLVHAYSSREARTAAEQAIMDSGFCAIELEDAKCMAEVLRTNRVHSETMELAKEVARTKQSLFTTFHTWDREDEDDDRIE